MRVSFTPEMLVAFQVWSIYCEQTDMNNIAFDSEKYYLGKLCMHGHDWNGTGQSLRRKTFRGCIKCKTEKARDWKKKNRDKVNERARDWRKRNRDKVSAYNREYAYNNAAKLKEKKRERYHKNLQLSRQKQLFYRENNREKVRQWDKNHYYKNRPTILLRRKKWKEQNQDYIKHYRSSLNGRLASSKACYKRKSRKLSNHHFDYSIQEISARLQDFDYSCAYCGFMSKVTLDHFIPLSKGGPDCIGNLIPACGRCNTSKHARDVREWYEGQEFYSKKRWNKILKVLRKTDSNYNQIPLF